MEQLLLHTCCAPCALMPYTYFKDLYNLTFFFYNPNIHPEEEFYRRRNTFLDFMHEEQLSYIDEEKYLTYQGYDAWAKELPTLSYPTRCYTCYVPRLEECAKLAAKFDYPYFTTTLLYSRYQKQEVIIEKGHFFAEKYGVKFIDKDFRPYWNEGIALSKEKKMYRQKYCGCNLPYTAL